MSGSGDPDQQACRVEQFSRLKQADRAELQAMPPGEAQSAVDRILHPRLWTIQDPRQLRWPGDFADADEEDEPVEGFAPEELASVFRSLQGAGWDAVLVGGQAVNLWARRYERDLPAWQALRPYTSRDLDYHGGLAEARVALRILRAHGHLNTGADPGPHAAVLKVPLPSGRKLLVDILTAIYGVSAGDVERTAVAWTGTGALDGVQLRVIHPLLLLEGKAASLRGLPQTGRQDAKHLSIMILVLHEWLSEQLSVPRPVFRAVERLAACAASPDGLHAFAQGLDLMESLPLEAMRATEGFADFLRQRLPQLLGKIARKREQHLRALDGDSESAG